MQKYIGVCIVFVALTGSVLVSVVKYAHRASYPVTTAAALPPFSADNRSGIITEDSTAPNFADPHVLLGQEHNVFVGKVINKIGARTYQWIDEPGLLFSVQPIINIKGNLNTPVIVNQFAEPLGPYPQPILQLGATYVFAARYDLEDGVYLIGPHFWYGYELLTEDMTKTDAQLKDLALSSSRVKELKAAYPDERVYAGDVKDHKAWNSYTSRHYDTKGELIDDTVVLHEQYLAAHPSSAPVNGQELAPSESASVSPAASEERTTSESVSPPPTPKESASPTSTAPEEATPTDTPTPTEIPVQS